MRRGRDADSSRQTAALKPLRIALAATRRSKRITVHGRSRFLFISYRYPTRAGGLSNLRAIEFVLDTPIEVSLALNIVRYS
jgi:hypothetical protein